MILKKKTNKKQKETKHVRKNRIEVSKRANVYAQMLFNVHNIHAHSHAAGVGTRRTVDYCIRPRLSVAEKLE